MGAMMREHDWSSPPLLYNDAYAEVLGAKHPRSLGSRFYDIWSEIWPDISPLIDAAMAGQGAYREVQTTNL